MSSSGKLDQSLDEILSTRQRGGPRRSTRRAPIGKRSIAPAPAGGIQKSKQAGRNATKPTAAKGSRVTGESKIMVSNLPKDVSEAQIKEYFQQSVSQVKKVEISYGPGGVSRGIAHVTFHHADGASKAFNKLNGLLIDNRPVKVEVVVANVDLIPQPKSLGQRISQPKVQPKSAATMKRPAGNKPGAVGKAQKKAPVKGRTARPKKTAEELDTEMEGYWVGGNGTSENTNGAAAGTGGDANMQEEEIL